MRSRSTGRCTARGLPRGVFAGATRGMRAASTRSRENAPEMMDTQRLIALVVFSFSAILLWEAWQKHNAPKIDAPTTAVPAASKAPAGVPPPPANPGLPAPTAAPTTATPAAQARCDPHTAPSDVSLFTYTPLGPTYRSLPSTQPPSPLSRPITSTH